MARKNRVSTRVAHHEKNIAEEKERERKAQVRRRRCALCIRGVFNDVHFVSGVFLMMGTFIRGVSNDEYVYQGCFTDGHSRPSPGSS